MDDDADAPLLVGEGSLSRTRQYVATVTATMCVFGGGAAISWISPALPMLESGDATLAVSPEQGSWVSSLLPVGALIGAPISGTIADTVGRKVALLSQGVLLLISWLMILVGESIVVLYIARVLAGIAVGVSTSVSPMYISEIADESLKGSLCSYTQLMMVSGVLYGYAVGAFFSYRTMAVLCELVAVVFLLSFVAAPESPEYLAGGRGRRRDAERWRPSAAPGRAIKAAALCALLMACQQFSGINVIIFYCTAIFTDMEDGPVAPSYATLLVGATQVVATYFSTLLLRRSGRKPLLIASSSLMAFSLMVLGAYFNQRAFFATVPALSWLPLLVVNLYVVAFSLGLGPVPFVLLGEMLPPDVKGVVSGLSVAVNWATAFLVVKCYDSLNAALGHDWTYWTFGALCGLISVVVKFCMIETKGKSVKTIEEELAGSTQSTGYVGI